MEEKVLVFYVKGSAKKPYRVAFWKEESSYDLHSGCGCPAGKRLQPCKHRFQIIEGDLTNLDESTENVEENLNTLYKWLEKSDIGSFYGEFIKAKNGERIYNLRNHIKIIRSDNIPTFVEYKNSSSKMKLTYDYKEIDKDTVNHLLNSDTVAIEFNKTLSLFSINNHQYHGTYNNIDLDNNFIADYGTFIKSEYLKDCYNFYKKIDIRTYNQKMKEIMK